MSIIYVPDFSDLLLSKLFNLSHFLFKNIKEQLLRCFSLLISNDDNDNNNDDDSDHDVILTDQ